MVQFLIGLFKTLHTAGHRVFYFTVIAALCSFTSSCSESPDPPAWSRITTSTIDKSDTTVPTTDHLIIYLDVSASMAGYVSPFGETIYGRALQELRNVASSLDPSVNIVVRTVDAAVGPPTGNLITVARASADPNMYKGGETNLAGAINLFSQGVDPEQHPGVPARFHIIVTDGVQSTNQQQTSSGCVVGSDQVCIRERILEHLKKGWGGTILGIRSQFHGKIFSEVNRAKKISPYAIQYDSVESDPDSFRPFYLYIFSPDPLAIEKLVSTLRERLISIVKEGGFHQLALTLPYSEGPATASLEVAGESKDYLRQSKANGEAAGRLTLRVDLNTERAGPKPFNIRVSIPWSQFARDTASDQDLAGLLKWEAVQVYPNPTENGKGASQRVRYPELKIVSSQPDNGNILVSASAHWPQATGRPEWRVYKIVGNLNLDRQSPPWIKNQQWSTELDNSTASGNKTLFLETALSNLWRNEILKNRAIAEFYIRLGPM